MSNPPMILVVLESLSYLSTIGLFIVALIGLKQLTLSKETTKLNAKRDALKFSNEQVRYYLEVVIPLVNNLDQKVLTNKLGIFHDTAPKLADGTIDIGSAHDRKMIAKQVLIIYPELIEALNAIEGFSTYYTSKLAEESVAFKSVGRTYCHTVGKYLPIVTTLMGHEYYQNTAELYHIWQGRLEAEGLSAQKDEIEKRLNNIEKTTVSPVGVAD